MEVPEPDAAIELSSTTYSQVRCPEELNEVIASGSLDFDSWTSLISETEKNYPDNIETISLVYESFLSKFPLCHGYWKKYADHKAQLCTIESVIEIFERAVQSATYSVGLWVDYCSFSMLAFADPFNIRRVFERGFSFVGKDFLCHSLWDMYIKFEFSQQQWSSLAHILIRTVKFPTKKLHHYYDNLKKFAAFIEEEMACEETCNLELWSEALPDIAVITSEDKINQVIKELQDSSSGNLRSKALHKYISIGEQFYRKACQFHEKIHCFENHIQRAVFHVKPLSDNQLENWHNYLDFIEKQDDFDWAVKLYERCLVSCATYPEFWMRYVEFMESKGGREIANFVLDRATQIFLKNVQEMHLFNARFKEQIGDIDGARAAFLLCDTESNCSIVETAVKEANMEKRLGNLAAACNIYDRALKVAVKQQNMHTVPVLYIHFYRLKYLITGSADAARDVIIDGIQRVPHCRLLLEELINFAMMHEGSRHLNVVDPIIATAITCGSDGSKGLDSKDREELSCLYLEFVDLCGTHHDVRKAWNRHIKLFTHLIRTPSSHTHSTTSSNRLFNVLMEGRQMNPPVVVNQPSRSHGSYHLNQISAREQEQVLLENHAKLDQVMPDQSQQIDGENCVKESIQHLSLRVLQCIEDTAEDVNVPSNLVHQSGDDVSEIMEISHNLHQRREDASCIQPSQEAASGQMESTLEFEHSGGPSTPLEAVQKYTDPITTQQEHEQHHEPEMHMQNHKPEMHMQDHEPGMLLNPVSLESLSLNSQVKESQDLTPTTLEDIIPQEISMPHENPSTSSPNHFPATDGAKKEDELIENGSGSSQTHPQPEVHLNSDETKCEMNHTLVTSGGVSDESHGHSQQKHQQEQASPLGQRSTAHMSDQPQVHHQFQGSVTQGNTISHAWLVPTMPQQSSVSPSQSHLSPQPVYSHPQAQISQYPIQAYEQLGIQQTQAYSQLLQYYQQQQQYQQQLLQMQQPYLLQQHQQPYHQALFQNQHLQQQQQQLQLQSYQPQQLQQQLYQLYQQQEQYQQLVQQYQLQQEQGYQQLMQQHQLQQQQVYQQMQQYQQLQQQQQPQDVHEEYQQQITAMQNQRLNKSHDQEGQGITQPSNTSTVVASESPYLQPNTASAPTSVVSPHHPHLSPEGGPLIPSASTS